MGHRATIVISLIIFTTTFTAASVKAIDFALVNKSTNARREVARVSLPVPRGSVPLVPANWLTVDGKQTPVQARVVTSYPDGSPRRIILSFLAELTSPQRVSCWYDPRSVLPADSPVNHLTSAVLHVEEGSRHVLNLPGYTLWIENDHATVKSKADGRSVAVITAYGPELSEPKPAKTTVVETGTHFVWLRWIQQGSNYSREIDFQVDRLGRIKMTQRILRHLPGDDWTPDFGFKLTATEAESVQVPTKPVHFLQFNPESTFGEHPELIASLKLANGITLSMANPLALRQNRGTLETEEESDDAITLRVRRIESVKDDDNKLMLQEGMWRVAQLVIQPGNPNSLTTYIDHPLSTHVDWRDYDAVYETGQQVQVSHPLLKRFVEHSVCILEKMSVNGDDWGNITMFDPATGKAPIHSQLRFNHCKYVWEDYFRTGDPRLRRIAIDWSENYRNFSVYWGPKQQHYGGSRRGARNRDLPGSPHGPGTYMERFNSAIGFCTKGFHNFWLTYEQTGDPRFKEAAEAQAKWSAEYVHVNRGQMRNVGVITDFTKLFEYTGNHFYLDQALRLWEEFKSKQCPDLLFTQGGRPATGNDLFIRDDEHGYRHPFYKAYMVQYANNSLPYLLKHRPDDQRLRDTIWACNNWMTRVQTPGGGWAYPAPTSPGLNWRTEHSHGLLLAHKIAPNDAYLDAIQHSQRSIITLYEKYGSLPFLIISWESVQNQEDLLGKYKLGTDRNYLKDFTHGKLKFLSRPDMVVYLQVVLRDYLCFRKEESLLTRNMFVEQMIQLRNNLPKENVTHEDQSADNRSVSIQGEETIPLVSLAEASAIGDVNLAKLLIEKGAAVNTGENSFFEMALHRATLGGCQDVVELLLAEGADINARDSFHASALHYAVERGHKNIVEVLLAKGADVNIRNSEGQMPFDIAMNQNRRYITELLIAHGSDLNTRRRHPPGDTPLHVFIRAGQKEVVKLLVAKGADVNAKNKDGKTPLDVALSQRHNDIVKLLVEEGADIPTIHLAAFVGSLDKLRSLVKIGTDVTAKDENGRTPLLRAVTGGHIDAVGFLIKNGADVNTSDNQDYVPLMHALWTMNSDMVKLLLDKGADVNAKDTPSGYTSLHWAVLMGSKELTELVLEAGGDVNAKSKTGETPLDLAKQGGPEIVKLLRKHGAKETSQETQKRRQSGAEIQVPDGVKLETDIAYREGNEKWRLDLAYPEAKGKSRHPGLVIVHGGGWRGGDKGSRQWRSIPLQYAAKGYVCISANYRLTDDAPFPACVEDVNGEVLRPYAEKVATPV